MTSDLPITRRAADFFSSRTPNAVHFVGYAFADAVPASVETESDCMDCLWEFAKESSSRPEFPHMRRFAISDIGPGPRFSRWDTAALIQSILLNWEEAGALAAVVAVKRNGVSPARFLFGVLLALHLTAAHMSLDGFERGMARDAGAWARLFPDDAREFLSFAGEVAARESSPVASLSI